jgi:hypothetical protein
VQQRSHSGNAVDTEAGAGGAGTHLDCDGVGRDCGEEVLIGSIVTDREHREGREPLGRKRWNDPPLVNAIGSDLDYLVSRQYFDWLIAE